MPNAYNLTTKTLVKNHLQISGSADDTFLDTLCDGVTAFIEKYMGGQRVYATEHMDELHDGEEGRYIRLKHRYIYADYELEVEVNNGTALNPVWTALTVDDYEVYPDAGVIFLVSKIGGRRNVRVTYKAGFSTIPSDIQLIATTMVGRFYNRRKSLGLSGESFEGVNQNWSDSMSADEKIVLDNYRGKLV